MIFECALDRLDDLPKNLEYLDASQNRIEFVCPLPDTLQHVNLSDNWLESSPAIPKRCKTFLVQENYLKTFPSTEDKYPESLIVLNISDNEIDNLRHVIGTVMKLKNERKNFSQFKFINKKKSSIHITELYDISNTAPERNFYEIEHLDSIRV